jgi:hypothetical protein
MAAAAVTMARQVGEGRSTCLWLPAPLSHLRHCGNPPDQLDEIRARVRQVGGADRCGGGAMSDGQHLDVSALSGFDDCDAKVSASLDVRCDWGPRGANHHRVDPAAP